MMISGFAVELTINLAIYYSLLQPESSPNPYEVGCRTVAKKPDPRLQVR
jgi:hypothetical protein